jgi:diguanylate cyclase
MRYRENREQTAELLRMVLPMMSRHAAGFHPLSYAVWYEYAAGTNQALKSAVDALIASGQRLGDSDIQELFDRHVVMRDIESSTRLRARIQKVVEEVTEATNLASDEVGRYNDGLGLYQDRLQRDASHEAIAELVLGLMGDTTRVLGATGDLKQNLQHSAQEAQRLRTELESAAGQAQLDPLTGLLNRRGLEQQVASAYPRGLPAGAMLSIEIDRYRQIVDTYGHVLGDRVLAAIGAQLLSSAPGEGALPARDRASLFLLWLPGATPPAAAAVAERIRRSVEGCRIRRQDSEQSVEPVSVSIGTTIVAEGETLAAVLARVGEPGPS